MIFVSDGIKYTRCPNGTHFDPKYQLPTVKHDQGNVMVQLKAYGWKWIQKHY